MVRRFFLGLAAVAAAFFILVHPAAAQQRIALVIGNAAYPKGPLQTSLADGGLVAEALSSIGFEIVEGADVNANDTRRLFGEFFNRVNAAGPDTIAFIYYNGYALQFEGDNYLIPVDARLDRDSDIPIQGVRLFDLLRPLADSPAITKVVVLDATRSLPFQIQGGQLAPGLGAIEAAPGLLVAFSSAPGTIAEDGPGPYGPYATAIAEMVREPGLDIDTLFGRVRLRTNETTNGIQTPWEVSQLTQVVMLVPGQPSAPQGFLSAPQVAVGAPVQHRRPPPRPIQEIGPEAAYAYVIEQDDLLAYSDYVRIYPDSAYAPRVWAMIRARREALLWRRALIENSPEAYWTYLERYPDGVYVFDARRRLRRLAAADRPPPGWRMRMYDDIPPPLAGEPSRFITVMPPAPPPRRYLAPPPAFIVNLPPPRREQGRPYVRPQQTFPVIIAPPSSRPGGQPPQRGPAVVTTPPGGTAFPPPGPSGLPKAGSPPGVKGAPPAPRIAPPAGGAPPSSAKGAPSLAPPATKAPPPAAKAPPPSAPPAAKAPPPPTAPAPPAVRAPSAPPPPAARAAPPPPTLRAAPPPPPPTVRAAPPPPPPGPPPAARAAPPPPGPPPAAARPPSPPPSQAQRGPQPGQQKGLPKCAQVQGKQPCLP